MTGRLDVLVLAGGQGRRLGGQDKPGLLVGGATLLDRVLAATSAAPDGQDALTVVVGPRRATQRPVRWVREEPPGGGPVAALATGLPLVTAPLVAVLAADLPFLRAGTLAGLVTSLAGRPDAHGALLVDAGGREQWLVGVWRAAALRRVVPAPADAVGLALRRVLGALAVVGCPAQGTDALDCDAPADLETARALARAEDRPGVGGRHG